MNGGDVIQEMIAKYAEWIEMSHDPSGFIAGIMANKIANMHAHIEYLEKIIDQNKLHKS